VTIDKLILAGLENRSGEPPRCSRRTTRGDRESAHRRVPVDHGVAVRLHRIRRIRSPSARSPMCGPWLNSLRWGVRPKPTSAWCAGRHGFESFSRPHT